MGVSMGFGVPKTMGAVGLILVAASACTRLEVNRVQAADDSASRAGYAYMLDYTQFDITVTRSLVSCDGEPEVKIDVAAAARLVPDGEQVYTINPASLISAFKTSDISVDYKDGRLIGFNADSQDKTADFVKSVASTVGTVAKIFGTGGFGAVTASQSESTFKAMSGVEALKALEQSPPSIGCTPDALKKLKFIEDQEPVLSAANAKLAAASSDLAALTAEYAANPSVALRRRVEAKMADIDDAEAAVDALVLEMAAAAAWLRHEVTVTWPEQSGDFFSAPMLPLPTRKIDAWFKITGDLKAAETYLESQKADGKLTKAWEDFAKLSPAFAMPDTASVADRARVLLDAQSTGARRLAEKRVAFYLRPQGSYGAASSTNAGGSKRDGLRYRVPARAWLYVCQNDQQCWTPGVKPVGRIAATVAQMGSVFHIPFSSPAFASGGISVTLDDQGRLLKAGLKRTNAAALSAADAAGGVASEAEELAKALREAPLNDLTARTKILKARKDLQDAEEALVKSPKESLEEEVALLEAQQKLNTLRTAIGPNRATDLTDQIKVAKLELELAELQKKAADDPDADLAAVRKTYDAETAVLDARRRKAEAEAALARAQRELGGAN
jgi:hypothetical protein